MAKAKELKIQVKRSNCQEEIQEYFVEESKDAGSKQPLVKVAQENMKELIISLISLTPNLDEYLETFK